MDSKNNYRSNSPKGLLGQLRITGFSPGYTLNNFLKIEFS